MPSKRKRKLSIAIPSSLVADIPHMREKTSKIGFIARALAIFRVDEVIVYPDQSGENQRKETHLLATLLSYAETPQYLRKYLFKIMPELRFAGTLPPLRTPHHPLHNRIRDLKSGEYREGVITSIGRHGAYADIGVERPVLVYGALGKTKTRVTIKVTESGTDPKSILVDKDEVADYWGYEVTVSEKPFVETVRTRGFDIVIATSRKGRDLITTLSELKEKWEKSQRILIAFGAPTQGLYEISSKEGAELTSVADYVINAIPNQGTETVRTEEAIHTTLSILNILIGNK